MSFQIPPNKGLNRCRVFAKTIRRDLKAVPMVIKMVRAYKRQINHHETLCVMFERLVRKHPNKPALVHVDGRAWTFSQVHEYSNAVANYLQGEGYKAGDTIAVMLENIPEMAIIWLGLSKIGVIGALINYNLRANSLVHCINIVNAKGIIYSASFNQAIESVRHLLSADTKYYCHGGPSSGAADLDAHLAVTSTSTPPKPNISVYSALIYIYTSGTTGLPKAAIINHVRYNLLAYSTFCLRLTPDDVIYTSLPLYHSAGCILGVGQALTMGCTVVIRTKFSASQHWADCIKYKCTAFQYIGELCRYLLAVPPAPSDRQHAIRVAIGNGLRPQIWAEFKDRFNIPVIGEFYGATEGNCGTANTDNTVGAVGFMTRNFSRLSPIVLVKVDEETGELIRRTNGLCVRCKPGEPGEMVGKVYLGSRVQGFDGYVDKDATERKLARNALKHGDIVFRSGDVLVMDELGYLYFCDRLGDTYRWRGENVSTAEVEATISNLIGLNDAVSYGVHVPGVEGRAGMVAIVEHQKPVDLQELYVAIQSALPVYARPIFIRILNNLDITGTFKLQKTAYRQQGYDPQQVKSDPVYYLDTHHGAYRLLDQQVFDDIQTGKLQL